MKMPDNEYVAWLTALTEERVSTVCSSAQTLCQGGIYAADGRRPRPGHSSTATKKMDK